MRRGYAGFVARQIEREIEHLSALREAPAAEASSKSPWGAIRNAGAKSLSPTPCATWAIANPPPACAARQQFQKMFAE